MPALTSVWNLRGHLGGVLILPLLLTTASFAAEFAEPPKWAQSTIWYQIFVERFRNGDPENDPVAESMAGSYPGYVPDGWAVTDWGHDWYEREPWAAQETGTFYQHIAARRFGGDLQGVLDRLDYLYDLGVTAIYFNPLNDSPSLHKYDVRNYRHIDRHFGPSPQADAMIMEGEDPARSETWQWTGADRLFLKLIDEIHRRGMRLILDYSWNHTGITFWAWRDVVTKQKESRFRDWYEIESFDDPVTPENEFSYHGWLGVKTLPELRKVGVRERRKGYPFEGNLPAEVKLHVFEVTRRWMDPNGDGDPSDGVDGFRLDVAPDVPLGFWRELRTYVRALNSEALLVGEAWWTKWPDELMDPGPFLQGDIFDSVMHYQWYRPARKFFAQANGGLKPSEFVSELKRVFDGYDHPTVCSLMNLVASHDSPRFATSFANKHQYKFRMGARGNEDLDLGPPTQRTLREMRTMLLHQFTFLGAPHIWAGDEVGMWGADDPDCRKPMLWDDIDYDPQVVLPNGARGNVFPVAPNHTLRAYYRKLISLRKSHREWRVGKVNYVLADDDAMTFAYERVEEASRSLVVFNRSVEAAVIEFPSSDDRLPELVVESIEGCVTEMLRREASFQIELQGLSGTVLQSR